MLFPEEGEIQVESFKEETIEEIDLMPSREDFVVQKISSVESRLKLTPNLKDGSRTSIYQLISQGAWGESTKHGNLITCNKHYMAYLVKSKLTGLVVAKIGTRYTQNGSQAIFSDVDADLVSLQFVSPNDDVLSLVDQNGGVYIIQISKNGDPNFTLKLVTMCVIRLPKEEAQCAPFLDSVYNISWNPWKYKLNFENKLIPIRNQTLLFILYGNNGNCIVHKLNDTLDKIHSAYENKSLDDLLERAFVSNMHESAITSCYFSPDSKYISTSGADGKFKIWVFDFETKTQPQFYNDLKPQCEHTPFENDDSIISHHWSDTRILSAEDQISFWAIVVFVSAHNVIKLYNNINFTLVQTIHLNYSPPFPDTSPIELIVRPLSQSFGTKLILATNMRYLLIFDISMEVSPDTSASPSNVTCNKWKFVCPFISEVYTMPIPIDVLDYSVYPEFYINKHLVGDGSFKCGRNRMLSMFALCKKNLYAFEFYLQNIDDKPSRDKTMSLDNHVRFSCVTPFSSPHLKKSSYSSPSQKHIDACNIDLRSKPQGEPARDSKLIAGPVNEDKLTMEVAAFNNIFILGKINDDSESQDSSAVRSALSKTLNEPSDTAKSNSNIDHETSPIPSEDLLASMAANGQVSSTTHDSLNKSHNLCTEDSSGAAEYNAGNSERDVASDVEAIETSLTTPNCSSTNPSTFELVDSMVEKRFGKFETFLNSNLEQFKRKIDKLDAINELEHYSIPKDTIALSHEYSQTIIKTLDAVCKAVKNIQADQKDLVQKVSNDVCTRMERTLKILMTKLSNELGTSMFNRMERLSGKMFADIDKTFKAGTQQYLTNLQTHLNAFQKKSRNDPPNESSSTAEKQLNEAIENFSINIRSMEKKINESIKRSMGQFKEEIIKKIVFDVDAIHKTQTSTIIDLIESKASSFNKSGNSSSISFAPSPTDEAHYFLNQDEPVKALKVGLNHNLDEFCLELCASLEPSKLIKDPSTSLSMGEMYKLVKLCSDDLSTNQNIKVSYLQEILLMFDVAEHRHDVGFIECIEQLVANFESQKSCFDKPTCQIIRMLSLICKRYLL